MENKDRKYCCDTMKQQLTNVCKEHGLNCGDNVIRDYSKSDKEKLGVEHPDIFGIPHPDDGSFYEIKFCPWCGHDLIRPKSQEEVLEKLGWEIICESPFEIQDKDGNFASGLAARIVVDEFMENWEDYG